MAIWSAPLLAEISNKHPPVLTRPPWLYLTRHAEGQIDMRMAIRLYCSQMLPMSGAV